MSKINTNPWTEQELDQVRALRLAGMTLPKIAQKMNRTPKSVEKAVYRHQIPAPLSCGSLETPILSSPETPEIPKPEVDLIGYWKKRALELEKALKDGGRSKIAEEILAERIMELAPVSYQPPAWQENLLCKADGHKTGQSAVLLLSDTHIGSVVYPGQTLGLGGYNFELFLRRLKRLERSIFSILQDHTTTPVPEIVIPVLGDMLDGALGHSAEAGQVNPLLAQFYAGGHALAQFVRNLSVIAPIRLYGCVGNHTRWQNQHKMPSKNRNSNYDALLYLYTQALTRDLPNVTWDLNWQPFATFDVQGFPFYCGHGDNLRGGDKALGLPAHAMGRMVSTTTQLFTRAGKDTPAYYCVGHLHRPISIPHAKGEIIVNGAFPGVDGYSLGEYFNSSFPIQKFWLMHPKFGRSATYDLRLDLGDDIPHGYELPQVFPCQ